MLPAGKRDQRILIEVPTASVNALGEEVLAWAELGGAGNGGRFAFVREQAGREFLKGDFAAEGKAVFCITWCEVDSTARVTWNNRVWQVEDVTGTFRDGEVWLHCRSVTGAN